MNDFPEFMKTDKNLISAQSQSEGVKGWIYDGVDGKQMAYWICEKDGFSKEHVHEFEEYLVVVQGRYTLIINGQRINLFKGSEHFIPKNVPHAGEFISGTRTIHCFGGNRANRI
jgi:quercetin dioxygenase-like cupin family protein